MKKLLLTLLLVLFACSAQAGDYCCPDTDHFATNSAIDNTREDMTRENAISTAMASLELDPTRDGFSMGVAVGVSDFADGDDEFASAVGLMYGRGDKAINVKVGQSGSYKAAGVGLTFGF